MLRRAALLDGADGLRDGQLLEAFLAERDEAAFEALVRRHGPMVLGVCRRVLGHAQDAEDAFQATFLVLARKAASVRPGELVGSWLYGVAYRTALKARTMNATRRAREARVGARPTAGRPDEAEWEELLPLLDEELSRLPDKYRVPVVLCDLEGKTRREAARLVGVPEGTLSGRLTTAHRLLARRLARHGPAVSGAALAAAVAPGAASARVAGELAVAAARTAVLAAAGLGLTAGAVPARVMALAEGVVKSMLLTKLKALVAVAFVAAVSVAAVGLSYGPGAAQAPPKGERPVADELEELRLEVAALRTGLDATRARVKALEAHAQAAREGRDGNANAFRGAGQEFRFTNPGTGAQARPNNRDALEDYYRALGYDKTADFYRALPQSRANTAEDPLTEAEAALRQLRKKPDDKQAADALEKALRQLRERAKPDGIKRP
jgi:RNA polymerase sigma factor (sigma-70 family)